MTWMLRAFEAPATDVDRAFSARNPERGQQDAALAVQPAGG